MSQTLRMSEIASAPSTSETIGLVLDFLVDVFGARPEKITLNRGGGQIETISARPAAGRPASCSETVEIGAAATDGRTHLSVTCFGPIDAQLRQDIEAVLQVGAINAALCERRFWKPAAAKRNGRQNEGLCGDSQSMLALSEEIEKLGRNPRPVLITGERGTGKTTIANAIHRNSPRAGQEFKDVDCTSFPENLLESELFGYEKGAFTDAKARKVGLFEAAEGGTLFLDEIGDLPLAMQAKLLKAIEQQKIRRIGATEDTRINVRIITATSKNLGQMKDEGRFRADLYDRLSVLQVRPCPLREKPEDIPGIVFDQLKQEEQILELTTPLEIEEGAVDLLMSYEWPGNIRELRNFVSLIVYRNDGRAPITVEEVRRELETLQAGSVQPEEARPQAARESDKRRERQPELSSGEKLMLPEDVRYFYPGETLTVWEARVHKAAIESMIAAHGGNASAASRVLGVHRNSIAQRLSRASKILQQAAEPQL